jgi:hypothetical protein
VFGAAALAALIGFVGLPDDIGEAPHKAIVARSSIDHVEPEKPRLFERILISHFAPHVDSLSIFVELHQVFGEKTQVKVLLESTARTYYGFGFDCVNWKVLCSGRKHLGLHERAAFIGRRLTEILELEIDSGKPPLAGSEAPSLDVYPASSSENIRAQLSLGSGFEMFELAFASIPQRAGGAPKSYRGREEGEGESANEKPFMPVHDANYRRDEPYKPATDTEILTVLLYFAVPSVALFLRRWGLVIFSAWCAFTLAGIGIGAMAGLI